MTKDKLEKLIRRAKTAGKSPGEFGQMLCGAPYNLTPPEATPLMKEYASTLTPAAKKPSPLKSDLYRFLGPTTHRVNKGQNVSSREVILNEGGPPEYQVLPAAAVPRLSIINRSSVRDYALKVAKEKRPKFKRVSAEFLDGVQASLESAIRELSRDDAGEVQPDAEADWLINGRTLRMVEEKLNGAVRAIVRSKVHQQPSVGVTLK